jgi:DNA-binding response OmpR family regulator
MDKSKYKILIVEDDQFLRDFYHELLTSEGYQVDAAPDGEVGLQKITQGGWNLVLLDIMLPKRDGVQILKEVHATGKPPTAPIVVLTNLGNQTVINQCLSLGAKGYLIKSAMDPDQVLSEIKSYLQG